MNTVNMSHNERLRECKFRFDVERAQLNHHFTEQQHEISKALDLARNERSYWLSKLKMGDDLSLAKAKVDELTNRIAELHKEKNNLDYDRRMRIIDLQHRNHNEIDRIEQEAEKGAES